MQRKFDSGQSLIEVVVAMSLVVVAVIALVSATLFTQKASRSASAQTQATKLAEENIEKVRVIRDRKGYGVLSTGLCKVIDSSSPDPNNWLLNNCVLPGETILIGNVSFTRRIEISEITPNVKKQATVVVSWPESGGTRSVSSVTFLSNCVGASC